MSGHDPVGDVVRKAVTVVGAVAAVAATGIVIHHLAPAWVEIVTSGVVAVMVAALFARWASRTITRALLSLAVVAATVAAACLLLDSRLTDALHRQQERAVEKARDAVTPDLPDLPDASSLPGASQAASLWDRATSLLRGGDRQDERDGIDWDPR